MHVHQSSRKQLLEIEMSAPFTDICALSSALGRRGHTKETCISTCFFVSLIIWGIPFPSVLFCFPYESHWFMDSFIHWTTISLSKHLLCADIQSGTENAGWAKQLSWQSTGEKLLITQLHNSKISSRETENLEGWSQGPMKDVVMGQLTKCWDSPRDWRMNGIWWDTGGVCNLCPSVPRAFFSSFSKNCLHCRSVYFYWHAN